MSTSVVPGGSPAAEPSTETGAVDAGHHAGAAPVPTPEPASSDPALLQLQVIRAPDPSSGPVLVEVTGEIDLVTVPAVTLRVHDELDRGAREVVIDVSGVRFCGASGLHALTQARAYAHRLGAELYLTVPSTAVLRLLAIARRADIDPQLPFWPDTRPLPSRPGRGQRRGRSVHAARGSSP